MKSTKTNLPKRRNGWYYLPSGEYVSATKVINDTLAKYALIPWTGYSCARIALKDPSLSDKEVYAEHQLKVRQSQDRGKFMHTVAETLAQGKDLQMEVPVKYMGYYRALRSWRATFNPKTLFTEAIVYMDEPIKVAGRADYGANIGGTVWLLDFKTGKDIYKEVGLQLAVYKQMLKVCNGVDIEKTGVVLLTSSGEFVFKETKDTLEDYVKVYRVWEWMKRKEE